MVALVTTIAGWKQAPAAALAEACRQRWEHEVGSDQLKTRLRGPGRVCDSRAGHDPPGDLSLPARPSRPVRPDLPGRRRGRHRPRQSQVHPRRPPGHHPDGLSPRAPGDRPRRGDGSTTPTASQGWRHRDPPQLPANHRAGEPATRSRRSMINFGPVSLGRAWYHCRECKHGFPPRDADLGGGRSVHVTRAAGDERPGRRDRAVREGRSSQDRAALIIARNLVPLVPSPLPDKLYGRSTAWGSACGPPRLPHARVRAKTAGPDPRGQARRLLHPGPARRRGPPRPATRLVQLHRHLRARARVRGPSPGRGHHPRRGPRPPAHHPRRRRRRSPDRSAGTGRA